VCNLGSVNLARHVCSRADGSSSFDFDQLASTVRTAVRQLNRVIDLNFYPIDTARTANMKWRPVGLGVMGLQDVFFKLRLPFDSTEALAVHAHRRGDLFPRAVDVDRAGRAGGAHPGFAESRAREWRTAVRLLAAATPHDDARWDALRERIKQHGLRNSLLIAIAPTATIASIAGCYECIEPQVSNLFKRETLSGDFLVVNRYLADELKALGLWTSEVRDAIKLAEGSIQGITAIPERLRADLSHHLGAAAEGADRPGRRARRVYRPEPVAEPVHGEPEHRPAQFDVHVRVEGRHQDHLLPALAAGHEDHQDHRVRSPAKVSAPIAAPWTGQANAAVFCSLENPEYCEACQ
jgi:ribonucleoside-diphosphate reductase alpha chain